MTKIGTMWTYRIEAAYRVRQLTIPSEIHGLLDALTDACVDCDDPHAVTAASACGGTCRMEVSDRDLK